MLAIDPLLAWVLAVIAIAVCVVDPPREWLKQHVAWFRPQRPIWWDDVDDEIERRIHAAATNRERAIWDGVHMTRFNRNRRG